MSKILENNLENNLAAVERYLAKIGKGSMAFIVRQALDKLFPEWRETE